MAIESKDDMREFLNKVNKTLIYLIGISEDAEFEHFACIFGMILASFVSGPEELEKMHDVLHDYSNGLMKRIGSNSIPGVSLVVDKEK